MFVLAVAGCQKPAPTPPARAAAAPGVSVDTGNGVLPLSAFSMGIAHALPVRNTPNAVPKVEAVRSFVVNVPNTAAADLKLYWVRDLDLIFSANQSPVQAETKPLGGSGYELIPPHLDEKGGYLMLVIASTNGGPSRYYAVALG